MFFDVWQQAGRFEGRSAVTTWLLSIARFKALSARRRRTHAELDEVVEATVADSADNAEVVLEKKGQGEMLRDALTKLSPEHREIIDLVYYHEKSVDDAADILSIPRATVKTRMFYARKKLASWCRRHSICSRFGAGKEALAHSQGLHAIQCQASRCGAVDTPKKIFRND